MKQRIRISGTIAALSLALSCAPLLEQLQGKDESQDQNLLLALALAGGGCRPDLSALPPGVPAPVQPADNCTTAEKAALGRFLFYDKRLSGNQAKSCASCHVQAFAFTDRVARPRGIAHGAFPTGELHDRNSQGLANAAYHTKLTWANPALSSLEVQAAVPLFAISGPSTIVELGLSGTEHLERLRADSDYAPRFAAAFGGDGVDSITEVNVRRAIAAFQRTLFSFNSPYDRFTRGQGSLSASALRGADLFFGEKAECFHCHGGFNFTDTTTHSGLVSGEFLFHNNGTYLAADYAALNPSQRGLYDVTGDVNDEGKFRAPSLRNIGLTFPYMHDGSIACDGAFAGDADACARNALGKVVDQYANGGKRDGFNQPHPTVDQTLIRPFALSGQERTDLIEFLMNLNDSTFISNPAFANPAPGDARFGP